MFNFLPLKKEIHVSDLISLFYAKSPKNYQFEGECHNFWELIYIDKGKMLITADENQYILKAGELAFHKPNEFHAVSACENIPSNYIVIAFVCESPAMQFFEHKYFAIDNKERECLYEIVRSGEKSFGDISSFHFTFQISRDVPFGSIQLLQAYLEILLILLLQRGKSTQTRRRVTSYLQQTSHKLLSKRVKAYLEEHISDPLSLNKIANDLGYSVSQMKTLFTAETGDSIINYFIEMKMDEAKRLIAEGDLNISQIAEQLGYVNTSYFSRLFKKRFDMTPSEYSRSYNN